MSRRYFSDEEENRERGFLLNGMDILGDLLSEGVIEFLFGAARLIGHAAMAAEHIAFHFFVP